MLLPDILTPTPTSPRAVLAQFQQRLENLLATGEYTPFVYPYRALGPNILILYLLLPPTKSKVVYYARYPLFVLISYLSVSAIRECRSSMVTVGYGIGLLNAWAVLWSACLVVFNDARGGFARIEEQELGEGEGEGEGEGSLVDGGADDEATTGAEKVVGGELRERLMDWEPKPPESSKRKSNESSSGKPVHHTWQKLPSTFVHRLDWVLDLVQNFRGPRWNYQISGLPPPPLYIQSSLKDLSQPDPNERSYLTRKDILRRDLPSFIMCCVALDAFKTITIQDPYFWSLPSSTPSPLPYPRLSRLVLTLAFTYTSLLTIFLLAPLVFGVLLGPRYIGQHAWPWLYPPYFGPSSQVWKKGLAGLWGGWWHQLFRYAFEQAGEFVGRGLPFVVVEYCMLVLHTRPLGIQDL
ncbi:hypothetical protein MMC28_006538 [Mycoblastus sanguinarius]|nr:hypothetical protein [Mycoblastus sanguinarius]